MTKLEKIFKTNADNHKASLGEQGGHVEQKMRNGNPTGEWTIYLPKRSYTDYDIWELKEWLDDLFSEVVE